MTSNLEFPLCALCSSNSRSTIHADTRDLLYDIPGQFAVVRCCSCGLVYLYPRPSEEHLAEYYPARYASFADSARSSVGNRNNERSVAFRIVRQIALLPYRLRYGDNAATLQPFGARRMLDVGCGAGDYLHDMQQLGWDVYGVDLSDTAVVAARKRVGASRVSLGTLEKLDPGLKEFDLITMNHCIEHVPDPQATLIEAYNRLSASGKLKIIVPDVSGFEARIFGRYWLGLEVPRHLFDFSRRTLGRFLAQSGFKVESCRPQFCPWTFYHSFYLVLEKRLNVNGYGLKKAVAPLVFLLAILSYSVGNRSVIEVVAQKAGYCKEGA
jgi:SAM-dependent methyltransferase